MVRRLTKLIDHSADAIALLHALVRDTDDPSRRRSAPITQLPAGLRRTDGDSGEHGRGQERVGHRLHVNEPYGLELTHRRSLHSGLRLRLNDSAAHGLEDLLSKARVALQRGRADVRDGA